jgi:hypothetical protein
MPSEARDPRTKSGKHQVESDCVRGFRGPLRGPGMTRGVLDYFSGFLPQTTFVREL